MTDKILGGALGEQVRLAPRSMYAQGQTEAEWKTYQARYIKDNEKILSELEGVISQKLAPPDPFSTDYVSQNKAVEQLLKYVNGLPIQAQTRLLGSVMQHRKLDPSIAEYISGILDQVSPQQRAEFETYIEETAHRYITDPPLFVSHGAIKLVAALPESRRPALYQLAREQLIKESQQNNISKQISLRAMFDVPGMENDWRPLIEDALKDKESIFTPLAALGTIKNMPADMQSEFYTKAVAAFGQQLKRNSLEDPLLALDFLEDLPEEYARKLDSSVTDVIQGAFSSVISGTEEGKELAGHHWRRMMKALQKMPVEQQQRLKEMAFTAFEHILLDPERAWNEKADVFEYAVSLSPDALEKLIRLGLQDKEERVRSAATMEIAKLPTQIAKPIEDETPITVPENPLYRAADARTENDPPSPLVSRLATTGANVSALLGKYREKVVARDFPVDRYLVWKKAFEAHQLWRKNGYEYVPIEPIIGVKKIGAGLNTDNSFRDLRVFSGFVGVSAAGWFRNNTRHASHIMNEMTRITKILTDDLKISHGHPHIGNFGLVFPRKSDGSLDFEKPPRLYMIDFDLAETTE